MNMVRMTIRNDVDGSLSLWLESDGYSEHRASYELSENRNHADFRARVAQVRADYEAQGIEVTYIDES
ncbi:hypothetical protein [Burkholderia stagnalis]